MDQIDMEKMLSVAKESAENNIEFIFIAPNKLVALILRIKELEATLNNFRDGF